MGFVHTARMCWGRRAYPETEARIRQTGGYLGTLVWGHCVGGTELRGFWPGCLVRECS